jgi:MFS superfamily sulfate permease-like transporter
MVFFNAPYFKRSALEAAAVAGPQLRWFVLDALPITSHDATGRYVFRELERELAARGVKIVLAGRRTEVADWRLEKGLNETRSGGALHYPTLRAAVQAFQELRPE